MTKQLNLEIPENEQLRIEFITHKAAIMAKSVYDILSDNYNGMTQEEFIQYRLSIFNKLLESSQINSIPSIITDESIDSGYEEDDLYTEHYNDSYLAE